MNPFEELNRLKRVQELICVIDLLYVDASFCPIRQARSVANALRGWEPSQWSEAALCGGINPAVSDDTQAAVIDHYDTRAARYHMFLRIKGAA